MSAVAGDKSKQYSYEFINHAVERYMTSDLLFGEVAEELGISAYELLTWVCASEGGDMFDYEEDRRAKLREKE